ncbi:DUF1934 family protein [Paradesulfitobacterium aromaticivorans]
MRKGFFPCGAEYPLNYKINLTAQGGHISLKYDLFVDDELVSHNSLRIIIKGEPPDEHL